MYSIFSIFHLKIKLIPVIVFISLQTPCLSQVATKDNIYKKHWVIVDKSGVVDTSGRVLSTYESGDTIILSDWAVRDAYYFRKNGKIKVVKSWQWCGTTTRLEDFFSFLSRDITYQRNREGNWKLNSSVSPNELTITMNNNDPVEVQILKLTDNHLMIKMK